jgi:multimeric flavodoxin WrbA
MNVTIVYGTERKSCTYNIAQSLVRALPDATVEEIFLPRDLSEYCVSCLKCFTSENATCTHDAHVRPIREKLVKADLIVLTSPVYSFHVSGQMKVFLDHFANMWLVHRPEAAMFRKQGVVIATASGPVYAKTLGEMKDSLDFWGVSRTWKLGFAVMQTDWRNVNPKLQAKIDRKTKNLAAKIARRHAATEKAGKAKPSFRVWKWFHISRLMQKYARLNPPDVQYWNEKGWTGKARPWK